MMTSIDRLVSNIRKRDSLSRQRYRETILAIANNPDGDFPDVEKVLIHAGKTIDQLREDLDTLAKRRRAANVLAGTDREIQEAAAREQACRSERDAAQARVDALKKLITEWDSAEASRVIAEERWRHALSNLSHEKAKARRFLIETGDRWSTAEEKLNPDRLSL